MFVMATSKY